MVHLTGRVPASAAVAGASTMTGSAAGRGGRAPGLGPRRGWVGKGSAAGGRSARGGRASSSAAASAGASRLVVRASGVMRRDSPRPRPSRTLSASADALNALLASPVATAEAAAESLANHERVVRWSETLKESLQAALEKEEYGDAARLRDEIEALRATDTVEVLREQMCAALDREDYDIAAALRDRLRAIVPLGAEAALLPGGGEPGAGASGDFVTASTMSEQVTHGVRVRVRSVYLPDRSATNRGYYFFAYRVTIVNESDQPVQLMARRWVITDDEGRVEEVRGQGVIGETPVLRPGVSFEYTSGCPLRTPTGQMRGSFKMEAITARATGKKDEVFGFHEPEEFTVDVAPFALHIEGGDVTLPREDSA